MAFEGGDNIYIPGLKAGADYRAANVGEHRFVKLSADKTVVLCAAVTDKPIGVLLNRPNTDEAAKVCALGTVPIQADALIAAGASIGTAADGQAAAYVQGTDTTKYVVGQVLDGAANAGERITAFINCGSPTRAA